ncbi:MAG: mechanosensitive ion channel [Candidatus Krumholzibacteriota bacterium]|nr:mechanosensitive ion channel [Candidatus Krumholzibacteriota bacterium]
MESLRAWLESLDPAAGPWLKMVISLAILIVVGFLANLVAKRVLLRAVARAVRASRTRWDDVILERHAFTRLSHLVPALVVYFLGPALFAGIPEAQEAFRRGALVYMLMVGVFALDAFLNAGVDIYQGTEYSRTRPIKGTVQVVKLVLYIALGIVIFSVLLKRSPVVLLSGLGAMTAVLLLIFKDAILGFVAGIQLTANDMLRRGDWIEMPRYGADGDVIDISLTTVKVRNWDKTITTIPAYALVSDAFKNWRGMEESGGRRIKRSLMIDVSSIRFLEPADVARLRRIQVLAPYIEEKEKELAAWNEEHGIDGAVRVNGRRMTNIGTFRAYLAAYLRRHPMVHQDMTFLVRQLQPTEHGLPLEIYVFSKDQRWAAYEAIQADIFDHVLAAVGEFGLSVYQQPSGADVLALAQRA